MIPFIKVRRKKRWLIGFKIKSIQEIFKTRWIAIIHEDGEFTVLPSWWAKCLTVKRFMKYITAGNLYTVQRNPYLH